MSHLVRPLGADDHVRGNARAPVTLLEYGDYECPACGQAYPVVEQLRADLSGLMRHAYRHFPMSQAHPYAVQAAAAAEAAGAQGRFWDMHDVLFQNQDALAFEDLVGYATQLDLDVDRFSEELEAGVHEPRIRADFRSGVRSGVNGTPTFFIEDYRYDGPYSLPALSAAIRAAAAQPAAHR